MQQGSSSESVEDTLDDLLWEAAASDAAAEATRPSRAEERDTIAAGEALAFEKGVDPKTGKVVTSLTNKWDAFVAAHGEEYGVRLRRSKGAHAGVHEEVLFVWLLQPRQYQRGRAHRHGRLVGRTHYQ